MNITEYYSSEGRRHGEAELEVLGTERSEAGNEKEEGGREQSQHQERDIGEDVLGQ